MPIVSRDEMSAREYTQHEWDKESWEKQAEHAIRIKQLDIEADKISARWNVLFRIPILIIKLPVLMILAVAFCIAVGRKQELSSSFWDYMR